MTAMLERPSPHGHVFDRGYWIDHCEGFRVDTPHGRLGVVEEVRPGPSADETVLAVRAGMLGRRLLLVSGADVEFIVPRAGRLWLHSPVVSGSEPADPR